MEMNLQTTHVCSLLSAVCGCGGGRIPLRLKVRLTKMEGSVLMWVPPPPGDRMWTSFTDLRCLDLTAKPVVRITS